MPTDPAIARELAAIRTLVECFEPLDVAARQRVLTWLQAVFPERPPRTNGAGRPPLSAAERRATSTRMRKSWQQRREGKAPAAKVSDQRQRTADLLATFDLRTPKPAAPESVRSMGPLVRRGYVVAKGEGYIRTGKRYFVNPRDAVAE